METTAATAEQPHYLTIEEAARHFRVSRPTLYRRCADGTLPHIRIGAVIRISREALEHLESPAERRGPESAPAVEAQAHGGGMA